MAKRIGNIIVLGQEIGECYICKKQKDVRPYGPNGEDICLDCGENDPNVMRRHDAHLKFLFGDLIGEKEEVKQ